MNYNKKTKKGNKFCLKFDLSRLEMEAQNIKENQLNMLVISISLFLVMLGLSLLVKALTPEYSLIVLVICCFAIKRRNIKRLFKRYIK